MTTFGYSGKPLGVKLGIKAGCRLAAVHAPEGLREMLEPLPEPIEFLAGADSDLDIVMLFETEAAALQCDFEAVKDRVKMAGMIWVAWPKKAAGAQTDLDENVVRNIGLDHQWVDVKVCAIDEYWSGLKFVRRLSDRT